MVTRETIATAVLQNGPVCVSLDGQIEQKQLAHPLSVSAAFLIPWDKTESQLFNTLHHDYSDRLSFLDGRGVAQSDYRDFFKALEWPGVHGCVVKHLSNEFLKRCRRTGRFIFVSLGATLSSEALPKKIGELLGKSRFNPQGWKNVGGMIDMQNASLLPSLEEFSREFPLLVFCTTSGWNMFPYMMQAAVTVAPGMRLIVLPVPPAEGSDGWRDGFFTATKHLAGTLQGAIVATR